MQLYLLPILSVHRPIGTHGGYPDVNGEFSLSLLLAEPNRRMTTRSDDK